MYLYEFFHKDHGFEVMGGDPSFYPLEGLGFYDSRKLSKRTFWPIDFFYSLILRQFGYLLMKESFDFKRKTITLENNSSSESDIDWPENLKEITSHLKTNLKTVGLSRLIEPLTGGMQESLYFSGALLDPNISYESSEPVSGLVYVKGTESQWQDVFDRIDIMSSYNCYSWASLLKDSIVKHVKFGDQGFLNTVHLFGLKRGRVVLIKEKNQDFSFIVDKYSMSRIPFYWEYLGESYKMAAFSGILGYNKDQKGWLYPSKGWGIREDIPV